MARKPTIFKTDEGAQEYAEAYKDSLSLWPVPFESITVPTSYGIVHLIASGNEGAPPLILLHMGAMSATMWYPNVEKLSKDFRVLAVDILNDLGKSIPTRPTRTKQSNAAWMVELVNTLGVDKAFIVGASNGGWLAMNFLIQAPERVHSVALLAPAGVLEPLSLRFYLTMLPVAIFPKESVLLFCTKPMASKDFVGDKRMAKQMLVGLRNRKMASSFDLAPPRPFSAKELCQIKSPVLLLFGELEMICNPHKALERARNTIPHIEAELIPKVGHGLSQEKPEIVNARLLNFFKRKEAFM